MLEDEGYEEDLGRQYKINPEIANDPLVLKTLNEIFSSKLIAPQYRADVLSEEDAAAKREDLPLLYVWNEQPLGNGSYSFSCSVNDLKLERLLEAHLNRDDPRFILFRNEIIGVLSSTAPKTVVSLCQQVGLAPSKLCVGDWYG